MRWDPLNDILRHREGGGGMSCMRFWRIRCGCLDSWGQNNLDLFVVELSIFKTKNVRYFMTNLMYVFHKALRNSKQ